MEIINYSDMENMIDTLLAMAITLEGVASDNYELNKFNYEVSEAWEQLTDGKITLIKYLENEYQQGHCKGPLIKRLERALWTAEDVINTAFKDDNKDVYHDWRAVAGLCREWADTISEYYRHKPEPGSIAELVMHQRKAFFEKMARDMMAPSKAPSAAPVMPNTKAADRLKELESTIMKALIEEGIVNDKRFVGNPSEFKVLVECLADLGVSNGKTKEGYNKCAWEECAIWVRFKGNAESARSSRKNETNTYVAKRIKAICDKYS